MAMREGVLVNEAPRLEACGHVVRGGEPGWCPTCERLQAREDAAEDARVAAARREDGPSPAACVGDEARAELQALAELLNGPQAPIVDAVPFTLRGEARKDDGAKPGRLPW